MVFFFYLSVVSQVVCLVPSTQPWRPWKFKSGSVVVEVREEGSDLVG